MNTTKTAAREWAKDVRECLRNAECWLREDDFDNALIAAQAAAASATSFFEEIIRLLAEAPRLPQSHVDRCDCGAKYWEGTTCVSCGGTWKTPGTSN